MSHFHITLRCSHQLEGGFLFSFYEHVKQCRSTSKKTATAIKLGLIQKWASVVFINLVCQNGLSAASEAADGLGSQFGNKNGPHEAISSLAAEASQCGQGWIGRLTFTCKHKYSLKRFLVRVCFGRRNLCTAVFLEDCCHQARVGRVSS